MPIRRQLIRLIICYRTQTVQTARAVAEKTRLKGKAEARALAAIGEAEATKMRLKANAYQRFVLYYRLLT